MISKATLSQLARRLGLNSGPGYVDHFDATRIAGWAFDKDDPGEPALLGLFVDGRPEMNIVADIPRADVQASGLGPLRCGFDVPLPRRLRDGRAHKVELRLGAKGPVLRGGVLTIKARPLAGSQPDRDGIRPDTSDAVPALGITAAAPITAVTAAPATTEGVAFYDSLGRTVSGWATGCNSVTIRFDGETARTLLLDREVAGFGSGLRPGFRVPIPAALQDGTLHEAHVTAGNSTAPLDGSPVRFSVARQSVFADLARLENRRATFRLRLPDGQPADSLAEVYADGQRLEVQGLRGDISVDLPEGARHLVLGTPQGDILARFDLLATVADQPAWQDLPADVLGSEHCAAATRAFEAFCAAPDDRFDPLWYRWAHPAAHPLETPAELLAHYHSTGAQGGYGPGPYFNEAQARALHPHVALAIAERRLPCAFALELAMGRGRVASLSGVDPALRDALVQGKADAVPHQLSHIRPAAPPSPVETRLPPPIHSQSPADSIYAAWVARLETTEEMRAELIRDERVVRHAVCAAVLTRAPLVSIIMPSWNRAFAIGEAIQSVLEQSYSNWELIICDDASEDRTIEVVRQFDDPRIRYMKFLKSNGAGARNKGLCHARGEYIAYLDSDNIWHPLFLDMMLRRLMAAPGSAIAYSGYLDTVIEGAKVRLSSLARAPFRPIRLSSKNFMDLNSIVHHRRLYDWLGGFDTALPRLQDWDLSLRYTSIFRPIFVNHIGVFYRRNVAWGQVTHLFMGSQAQNTVNDKTRRRLEEAHERLRIAWPARGRITVIAGARNGHLPSVASAVMAEGLARLALTVADVDLIELGGDTAENAMRSAADPAGLTRHLLPQALQRDPGRLGAALGGLIRGRPVLTVGCDGPYLGAIAGLDPQLTYRLRNSGEGSSLQGLADPLVMFDLGAVPLHLPEGGHAAADMTLLVLLPQQSPPKAREILRQQLIAEAQRRGLTLVLLPGDGMGWTKIDGDGVTPLLMDPVTRLPRCLGQVAMTVSMAPVSELMPFELALLNALQGRGAPAAVLQDQGRARATGFARQWLEASAAYEIKVNEPKWIFDKTRKLLGDAAGMERLGERSQTAHRIAYHPELARERMAYALYRLLHETPEREVIDG
ncbi:glycosyltransferase family 2 protein [Pseudorhodobacter sp.]|uniref:glycosyltransferase family 2 protein n=1 Tax=Pseudorhodobacter sp. TaxID=1934400 RepID=UPI002AFF43ED|nr:glycosyltransferase [Pseudorhodobacter sp.]